MFRKKKKSNNSSFAAGFEIEFKNQEDQVPSNRMKKPGDNIKQINIYESKDNPSMIKIYSERALSAIKKPYSFIDNDKEKSPINSFRNHPQKELATTKNFNAKSFFFSPRQKEQKNYDKIPPTVNEENVSINVTSKKFNEHSTNHDYEFSSVINKKKGPTEKSLNVANKLRDNNGFYSQRSDLPMNRQMTFIAKNAAEAKQLFLEKSKTDNYDKKGGKRDVTQDKQSKLFSSFKKEDEVNGNNQSFHSNTNSYLNNQGINNIYFNNLNSKDKKLELGMINLKVEQKNGNKPSLKLDLKELSRKEYQLSSNKQEKCKLFLI